MAPDIHDRTSLVTGAMSHRSSGMSKVRHGGMSVMSYRQESYRQESGIRRHQKLYGLILWNASGKAGSQLSIVQCCAGARPWNCSMHSKQAADAHPRDTAFTSQMPTDVPAVVCCCARSLSRCTQNDGARMNLPIVLLRYKGLQRNSVAWQRNNA